jgi:hypothetical protein
MLLSTPVEITPRLLPGVRVGSTWVAIEYAARNGADGRTRYQWRIDLPDGSEHSGDDHQSGCCGGNLREGLESLLSFLSACGESVNYGTRTGSPGENADLFPPAVAEWAAQNTDELSTLATEVEESPGCIQE